MTTHASPTSGLPSTCSLFLLNSLFASFSILLTVANEMFRLLTLEMTRSTKFVEGYMVVINSRFVRRWWRGFSILDSGFFRPEMTICRTVSW